jgi:hypothetical protein
MTNLPKVSVQAQEYLRSLQLPSFLKEQVAEHGCKTPLEDGTLWVLFAVETSDEEGNALARLLLSDVKFIHDSGLSADDQWTLYYVDSANKAAAEFWLQDLNAQVTGALRPVSDEHRALIRQLAASPMPHRIAMQLGQMHSTGELTAGCINDRALIRTLLDRCHLTGPMALPAFKMLLAHQLIDLVVLFDEIAHEDIEFLNDLLKIEQTNEPAARARQDAAVEVHRLLTRFHLINSLEQDKNQGITNPYVAYLDITAAGDRVVVPVDNALVRLSRVHVLNAVRSIRKQLYRGDEFETFDTLAPWITDEVALPFRFIKQQFAIRKESVPLDWLYIIERAI